MVQCPLIWKVDLALAQIGKGINRSKPRLSIRRPVAQSPRAPRLAAPPRGHSSTPRCDIISTSLYRSDGVQLDVNCEGTRTQVHTVLSGSRGHRDADRKADVYWRIVCAKLWRNLEPPDLQDRRLRITKTERKRFRIMQVLSNVTLERRLHSIDGCDDVFVDNASHGE